MSFFYSTGCNLNKTSCGSGRTQKGGVGRPCQQGSGWRREDTNQAVKTQTFEHISQSCFSTEERLVYWRRSTHCIFTKHSLVINRHISHLSFPIPAEMSMPLWHLWWQSTKCVCASGWEAGGSVGVQAHLEAFLGRVAETCGPGRVHGVGLPWCFWPGEHSSSTLVVTWWGTASIRSGPAGSSPRSWPSWSDSSSRTRTCGAWPNRSGKLHVYLLACYN